MVFLYQLFCTNPSPKVIWRLQYFSQSSKTSLTSFHVFQRPVTLEYLQVSMTVFNLHRRISSASLSLISFNIIVFASDYQTSHFLSGFIGEFFGQLNCSANSLEFDTGPITLKPQKQPIKSHNNLTEPF